MYNSHKSNGIGPAGILFIIFLTLKITGVINWSWWWVTSPLWIPFALIVGGLLIWAIIAIIITIFSSR